MIYWKVENGRKKKDKVRKKDFQGDLLLCQSECWVVDRSAHKSLDLLLSDIQKPAWVQSTIQRLNFFRSPRWFEWEAFNFVSVFSLIWLLLTEKQLGHPSDKKMHWWVEVTFALDCDDGIEIYEIIAMFVICLKTDDEKWLQVQTMSCTILRSYCNVIRTTLRRICGFECNQSIVNVIEHMYICLKKCLMSS